MYMYMCGILKKFKVQLLPPCMLKTHSLIYLQLFAFIAFIIRLLLLLLLLSTATTTTQTSECIKLKPHFAIFAFKTENWREFHSNSFSNH